MNRRTVRRRGVGRGVPRTRGDEPVDCDNETVGVIVFPARAGMNRGYMVSGVITPRVPRTRGDEPAACIGCAADATCSPHARG